MNLNLIPNKYNSGLNEKNLVDPFYRCHTVINLRCEFVLALLSLSLLRSQINVDVTSSLITSSTVTVTWGERRPKDRNGYCTGYSRPTTIKCTHGYG